MAANESEDPAVIEQDVERTQDAMGDTVQKLEERLNPRKIAQSLFSDDNAATAQDAWAIVKESPVPVAMIAVGTAWLFATSKAPAIARLRGELKQRFSGSSADDLRASLRPRSEEPAPIGPPPVAGEEYDRRAATAL